MTNIGNLRTRSRSSALRMRDGAASIPGKRGGAVSANVGTGKRVGIGLGSNQLTTGTPSDGRTNHPNRHRQSPPPCSSTRAGFRRKLIMLHEEVSAHRADRTSRHVRPGNLSVSENSLRENFLH